MRLIRLSLTFIVIGLALPLAGQTERILFFNSQITVNPDASMRVKETIVVQSAGQDIRHGIYRDFPTRYKDRAGNSYIVGFEIVSVLRDGSAEAYHTEGLSNGVRVYLGSSSSQLEAGRHTYEFNYRTRRQLGFFDDHDELYWNVTGNGWKFPINLTTATVVLPAPARNAVTELTGYTGYQGEKRSDFAAGRDEAGNPVFQAWNLGPQQGLTIVVRWPRGFFQPPSRQQRLAWFLQDNRGAIAGLAGLAVILAYYLAVWSMVGRDPAPGTLVPLYEPPDDLSAAAMRYLERMGFDDKVFTASILGLASKGCLSIERDESGNYHLARKPEKGAARMKLSADEKTLADVLFESGDTLDLEQANSARLQQAQKALQHSLQGCIEKTWFVTNARYLWPGVALTLVTAGAAVLMSGGSGVPVGIFMSVWLTGWTLGVSQLMRQVGHAWQGVRAQKPLAIPQALFKTAFSVPFLAGEVFGIFVLGRSVGAAVVLVLCFAIASNILFHYLLKAPTRAGRQILDRVQGFKMFLSAVEGDRLNRMAPVAKTPELFERFLPYALALGVEHAWAQQFVQVLAAAAGSQARGGAGYVPSWYSGTGFSSFSPSDFTSSFSSSFSSAVSSASTPPGSSSGSGGGGSSGGGGGGGGGGGW